ncbi:XTP/dITP diphosphatase [candidate division KSB1 bacterium]|nr:XTP/dITP diphosphatase [candidate division KSB1 bacterium]
MSERSKKKVILATRNQDKIVEMKDVLSGLDIDIITLDAFPQIPEVVEDGETLNANAGKKARLIQEATGITSIADDTGLEVDALSGEPGVYSSRFAGENATYINNNEKLLHELRDVPTEKRTARFRCVMAIAENSSMTLLEGTCHGVILEEMKGSNGFGYDPLFYVLQHKQTFAEMDLSLKNSISHRGKALRKVRQYFENNS